MASNFYGACSDGGKSTPEVEQFSVIIVFMMFDLGDLGWMKGISKICFNFVISLGVTSVKGTIYVPLK